MLLTCAIFTVAGRETRIREVCISKVVSYSNTAQLAQVVSHCPTYLRLDFHRGWALIHFDVAKLVCAKSYKVSVLNS